MSTIEAKIIKAVEDAKKKRTAGIIGTLACGMVGAVFIIVGAVSKVPGVRIGLTIIGAMILALGIWPLVVVLQNSAKEAAARAAGFSVSTMCDVACLKGSILETIGLNKFGQYSPVCIALKKVNVCA